ncbi:hypothetical protein ABZX12_26830 [Kribbella sp. NPDC003505]|uniref:hypothetical protein n=1 Tax=Kribbella sp. NPDC003505 TaxID=3154448 RepID=UPI0033B26D8E
MSFERPGLDDKHGTVSDTEVNDALESGELDKGGLNFDQVEHDEGRPSPGPESTDADHEGERRPPDDQDVTDAGQGEPVEPPD